MNKIKTYLKIIISMILFKLKIKKYYYTIQLPGLCKISKSYSGRKEIIYIMGK